MKCPHCPDTLLLMNDRQGVEIDYCPKCRGVWLDRGELDKLIERATAGAGASTPTPSRVDSHRAPPQFVDSDYKHHSGHHGHYKKSWLKDFFD